MSLFTVNSTYPIAITDETCSCNAQRGAWYSYAVLRHDGGALMKTAELATADVLETNRESCAVRDFVEQLKKMIKVAGVAEELDIGIEDISVPKQHDIDMLRIGSTYFIEEHENIYTPVECFVTFGRRA